MPIRKPPALLLGLSLALPLTACGDEVKSTPDPVRFERVPLPTAPKGEAICDGVPCLSDRQVGELLNQAIDTACAANDKLAWLSDYFLETELPSSCPATE